MMPQIVPILHIAGAVFAFVNLVLSAIVVDYFSIILKAIVLVVFSSVWSLLAVAYLALAPVFRPQYYRPMAGLGVLLVTTIFWISAAIAETHEVGTFVCGLSRPCQTAQASIAFSFFLLAIFAVLTIFEALEFKKSWRFGSLRLPQSKA